METITMMLRPARQRNAVESPTHRGGKSGVEVITEVAEHTLDWRNRPIGEVLSSRSSD